MGIIIVLILLVVVLCIVTSMTKVSKHRKIVEKMESENKYIDADTGEIREWPIGSFYKESEGKLGDLYASKHKLKELQYLITQGYSISLHDDDEDKSYKVCFHDNTKPIGIYEKNGIVKNLYRYNLDSVQEAKFEMFLFNQQ